MRAVRARLGHRAARLANLGFRQIVDVGPAAANEQNRPVVELLEVVRGMARLTGPLETEPVDVVLDRFDVPRIFGLGIRVVEAEIADAVEFLRDPEVEADRLRVTDVEIPVGFGWEPRDHTRVDAARNVFADDRPDEIRRLAVGLFRLVAVCAHVYLGLAGSMQDPTLCAGALAVGVGGDAVEMTPTPQIDRVPDERGRRVKAVVQSVGRHDVIIVSLSQDRGAPVSSENVDVAVGRGRRRIDLAHALDALGTEHALAGGRPGRRDDRVVALHVVDEITHQQRRRHIRGVPFDAPEHRAGVSSILPFAALRSTAISALPRNPAAK